MGVPVQVVDVHGRTTMQPAVQVARQNVTTHATADASQRRRRTEANFVCPVPGCGSTFTRHFNLKGHMRSHNEERPFKCKWPGCDKGFARQHDCKRHEQLHLNIRPYVCQGCQRQFARMDALNRHRECLFSFLTSFHHPPTALLHSHFSHISPVFAFILYVCMH
ncbi:hypothetical protein BD410DRAFT_726501 [Rickenella mellea]|uniref:C2H2-type domain-containing protein n=1 Tax=Rickenella mellea TaxID=50990 RepID=A0A4Y7PY95_9AGAM|nr:hypothetical protein BD410DRAFT_726501 [Rickenella mellea]